MNSLTAVGESKSLTEAGDSEKSSIVEDEKSLLTARGWKIFDCWGISGPLLGIENPWWLVGGFNKTSLTSAGNENSDDLYWGIKTWETSAGEVRLRIFNLLGNISVGRMFTVLVPLGNRIFRVFGLHWGSWNLTLRGIKFWNALALLRILKLNSAGEIYSKFSLVEGRNDVSQGISSEMA